jgi:hypothetical protein
VALSTFYWWIPQLIRIELKVLFIVSEAEKQTLILKIVTLSIASQSSQFSSFFTIFETEET